jgi:hypothetical protein
LLQRDGSLTSAGKYSWRAVYPRSGSIRQYPPSSGRFTLIRRTSLIREVIFEAMSILFRPKTSRPTHNLSGSARRLAGAIPVGWPNHVQIQTVMTATCGGNPREICQSETRLGGRLIGVFVAMIGRIRSKVTCRPRWSSVPANSTPLFGFSVLRSTAFYPISTSPDGNTRWLLICVAPAVHPTIHRQNAL